MNTATGFIPALAKYVRHIQAITDDYYAKNYSNLKPPVIAITEGKRYVRVVKQDAEGSGASVHTFVDVTNGNILKGSWKAPVKNGVRGNIFTDYSKVVNQYGAEYLR